MGSIQVGFALEEELKCRAVRHRTTSDDSGRLGYPHPPPLEVAHIT